MDLPQTVSTNISRIAELIVGMPTCMLTTVLGGGSPHARPMAAQEQPFDGSLWFLVDREARVVHEIRANRHVGVTFSDAAAARWVSLSGTARIVEDRAIISRLWKAPLETWFPEGPSDPAITLIQVEPSEATFWEGPPAIVGHVFDLARAALTGRGGAEEPGISGRLQLRPA